ncbi:MAG: methyltransferase domain-containing protein [Acidimicrobiales bacterium]
MTGDMMFQDEIRDVVRTAYRAIPSGAGRAMAGRLYSEEELSSIPERAIGWALGVGNPVRHAGLSPGDVVLDIGCGGGIDTILAARRVGPEGRVVGLDMLPEMCDRARAAAQEAGTQAWCEFQHGLMEDIPLPDASIDVVISNGVINLSPRKGRALAEIARVLKPGGRFCVADLTVDDDLPSEVLTSGAAWAGCISGALSEQVLTRKLDTAGLGDVEMSERAPFGIDDVALYPLFTAEVLGLMRRLIPRDRHGRVAVGLIVRAVKPDA